MPLDIVESIVSAFSLKHGEPNAFALEPSPFSILREKPILALGDGRYFLPTQALLFPAVQSRLEDLLNPDVTARPTPGLCSGTKARGRQRSRILELLHSSVARIKSIEKV